MKSFNEYEVKKIKDDLKHQLEFEETNWFYFIETAKRAMRIDKKFEKHFKDHMKS